MFLLDEPRGGTRGGNCDITSPARNAAGRINLKNKIFIYKDLYISNFRTLEFNSARTLFSGLFWVWKLYPRSTFQLGLSVI